ncbi:MAG: aminotransferase class I/II-fold pyridoxal phosphate-dependent enzyme [Planctomycetota bacterium]
MTRLAQQHNAINLAQGFPDFDGPPELIAAAEQAMARGDNQYARSQGHPLLVRAVTDTVRQNYGLSYDPDTEVGTYHGATEGIAACLLGLLNPSDEIILFEPFYDSYPACAELAGAVPRYYTLRYPDFAIDGDELAALFTPRTRVLLLNTPHNPTGRVFSRAELETVARLCQKHDVVVVADEVYEHLTFAGAKHVPIASLPGMRERTLTLSSAGKSFSMTGWKVGWATGPRELITAAQTAHQFLTFCGATPLHVAVAQALRELGADYFAQFRRDYEARRALLLAALERAGFNPVAPAGTYFILADISPLWDGDDVSFARHLVEQHGVAAIPTSVFYREHPEAGRSLMRFAFCKRPETLIAAGARLQGLRAR